jgi:DNA-binding response OmpR family regulator
MNQTEPIRALIVEDEAIPAHYLKGIIEKDTEYVVEQIVPDAPAALQAVEEVHPEIIFMDIMLEGAMSGAELALKIHMKHPEILILFMTAYSNEEMMEYAVESEAFAYMLKPYRPREIHATLKLAKARLRKLERAIISPIIDLVDGYHYHTDTQTLMHEEHEMVLTIKERLLIQMLCENANSVVSKTAILQRLEVNDSSLRSLIYRIRKLTSDRLILSVKRYGYRIGLSSSMVGN